MNSNTTPWSSVEYVSTPLEDAKILDDVAGLFHRTELHNLDSILKEGLKPGSEAGKSRSKMIQLSPHCPWDNARRTAQGRTDDKYCV